MLKDRIKTAIDMIVSNRGEDWFIVLEGAKDEKFVQFTYDEGYGLQLDLPVVALKVEELARAEKLLGEYSIVKRKIEYSEEGDCCCGEEHGKDEHCDCGCEDRSKEIFESFNEKIEDTNRAVEIAYRVFKEVYLYQDNWELNVTIFR